MKAAKKNHQLFLDYYNNFLTMERFTSWYGMSPQKAKATLLKGRVIHQDRLGYH